MKPDEMIKKELDKQCFPLNRQNCEIVMQNFWLEMKSEVIKEIEKRIQFFRDGRDAKYQIGIIAELINLKETIGEDEC